MTDIQLQEQSRLWDVMREIDPPPGAHDRVLRAIEQPSSHRFRWPVLAVLAVPLVAAVAFVFWVQTGDSHAGYRVSSASGVRQNGAALSAGDWASGKRISVAQRGHLQTSIGEATFAFSGPSSLQLSDESLLLDSGSVSVTGSASIAGPTCLVEIDGESRVDVVENHLAVTVFAGDATITEPVNDCFVVYAADDPAVKTPSPDSDSAGLVLEEPTEPIADEVPLIEQEAVATAEARRAKKRSPTAFSDVELTKQTKAYWRLQSLRKSDPSAALLQVKVFKKTWPRSPLQQEVDLARIDTLLQLGQVKKAQRAARRFLRRYPRSPRADELKNIAQGDL